MEILEKLQSLHKALEAGIQAGAPDSYVQGAALAQEDLSNVMINTTFQDEHLKLQKKIKSESTKGTLYQFNRQLSYGNFGGAAQYEGHAGQEETGTYIRATVPMCFYSHTRRVTDVAKKVASFDGTAADDREANNAVKKVAGDTEFDSFRGLADFSNAGVFDGNPDTMWKGPNIHGVDLQVRQSDNLRNTKDLMFAEYGSDDTVVVAVGGPLQFEHIEDVMVRSGENWGTADSFLVDQRVLSGYNKQALALQRIVLAGSPQGAAGADLKEQWTSVGTGKLEASNFLRGKRQPAPVRSSSPAAIAISAASVTAASTPTTFALNEVYKYTATACNEKGESTASAVGSVTISAAADTVEVTITHASPNTARYFNVYRTLAGGAAGTQKYIGRVLCRTGSSTTVFTDLGNKLPGFVTGFCMQWDTLGFRELAPYSRKKFAETEYSSIEGHYRWLTLAVYEPRKMGILDNLQP